MNVLIASYNLISEKSHLMPWRYVCEVVAFFNKNGHQARVISIGDEIGTFELPAEGITVWKIRKDKKSLPADLAAVATDHEVDVIFWPVSWREKQYRLQALKNVDCPVIGYFPGGIYSFSSVVYAFKKIGFRHVLPYAMESLLPKKRQLVRFKNNGISALIALTDLTARHVKNAGWPADSVYAILPGKEDGGKRVEVTLPNDFTQWLGSSKYLIFMGPPTPIRGCYELLSAFNSLANTDASFKLVCLFRSDKGVEQSSMKAFINNLSNEDQIYIVWESLERSLLEKYISHSYAIALPFLIVPSEIPLALIDAASYGKPVITTKCGGSGEYVERYGVTVDLSDENDFKEKLLMLVQDKIFYAEKCLAAQRVYEQHPTWDEMSEAWLDVAKKCLPITS